LISYEEMKHGQSDCWVVSGNRAILDFRKMECRCFIGLQLAQADPARPTFPDFLKIAGSLISSGSARAAKVVA
jgi:hypothetical protein